MSERTLIAGPAGALEIALDVAPAARAIALVCHPHPLHGGSLDNKVVTTISKAFGELGCCVLRFNFRGVGKSEGAWDEGAGEADDALAALAHLRHTCGADLPLLLAGFSFGAFVAAKIAPQVSPAQLLLVGTAVSRFAVPEVNAETHVIHGETDDVVPLAEVLNWARPQALPVTVFPGAGHFFHGQLVQLKAMVKTLCQF